MDIMILALILGIAGTTLVFAFSIGKLRRELSETKEIVIQTRASVTEIHGDVFRRAKTRNRRKLLPKMEIEP